MKKNILSLIAMALVFTVACKPKTETVQEADAKNDAASTEQVTNSGELLEGTWVLSKLTTPEAGGKTVKELFKDKTPTLKFNTKELRVEGNDGCNGIGGTYDITGDHAIRIGDKLVGTMMHCEGVAYNDFLNGLKTVTKFDIVGEDLLFISGDIVVMQFTKQNN